MSGSPSSERIKVSRKQVSKETMLLRRLGYYKIISFINWVDNVNWIPWKVPKADISSLSPSSERIKVDEEKLWYYSKVKHFSWWIRSPENLHLLHDQLYRTVDSISISSSAKLFVMSSGLFSVISITTDSWTIKLTLRISYT